MSCVQIPTPDWVEHRPIPDAENEWLIAYGQAQKLQHAKTAAFADLYKQMERVLVNQMYVDDFTILENIEETLENIIQQRVETLERANLLPVEEYVHRLSDGTREVFLLVPYSYSDIQEDMLQTAVILPHIVPANSSIWTGGLAYEEIKRIFSVIPSTRVDVATVINRVAALVKNIFISVFPAEFTAKIGDSVTHYTEAAFRSANDISGIADMRLIVKAVFETGELVEEFYGAFPTDADGVLYTRIPMPQLVGITHVHIQPYWLREKILEWQELINNQFPEDSEEFLDILAEIEAGLTASVILKVESSAANIPTAVVLSSQDIAGNSIVDNTAAHGAVQELRNMGFQVRDVDISPGIKEVLVQLPLPSAARIKELMSQPALGTVDRIIIGNARITEFTETNGFSISVVLRASALDLTSNTLLSELTLRERISGSDANTTIQAAFQSIGRRAARYFALRLP